MRKQILPTLLAMAALTLIGGCKKEDAPAPASGNNGNGGGTGNNGNGLVTSWSPVHPYPDDEVTLAGGPFNTDLASNTVSASNQACEVISVSPTQIVVRAVDPDYIAYLGITDMAIQSGAAFDTIETLHWKRTMRVISFDNLDDVWDAAPARPGDSLKIEGSGFTLQGMSLHIDGNPVAAPYLVDSSYYTQLYVRIPVELGQGTDESTLYYTNLTLTNADGRTDTLLVHYGPTPDMEVYGLELPGGETNFDRSDMLTAGLVFNFHVFGKYINSSQAWYLSGPVTANGTIGVSGYPDDAYIMLTPSSLTAGDYTLHLSGTGMTYGFTLVE